MSVGKRRAPLRSSGPPERRTEMPRVNRKRKAANHARAYGDGERIEWVKLRPCANCSQIANGSSRRVVNAHIKSGGIGRKADARFNIPLCEMDRGDGCHQIQHGPFGGWSRLPRLDTPEKREAAAAKTEAAWLLHQRAGAAT